MSAFLMFIHILCGVTFFGIVMASFIYIHHSIREQDPVLLSYALKASLMGDCIVFPMILIQLLTGTFLVYHHHLPLNTPWIIVAYLAFATVSVIWFLLVLIKYVNFFQMHRGPFRFKKPFYYLSAVIVILFCIIVHDAVTQSTWLFYTG